MLSYHFNPNLSEAFFSCFNLFFAGDGVRFVGCSGLKSVVFLVNNCLITAVRLLLVVDFPLSCVELIISFDNDEFIFGLDCFDFAFDSSVNIFVLLLSIISSLLLIKFDSCFLFLEPN